MRNTFKQVIASPSKSFAAALVCFSLGVACGPLAAGLVDPAFLLAAAIVAGFAFITSRPRHLSVPFALFASFAIFLLGLCRYGFAALPSDGPTVADAADAGESVHISGTIASEVETRPIGYRAALDRVSVAGTPAEGKILLWLPEYPDVAYGDTIAFECALERPEPIESFRYDRYLQSQGILAVCFRPQGLDVVRSEGGVVAWLLAVKTAMLARLATVVPEPHASFLAGLIFGGSSSLSADLKDDFAATGTSHVLAASGFNVSLFTMAFLTWVTHTALGRRRGAYATAALLLGYVLVAGATSAVVRAAVMGAVVLLGFVVRRKPSMLNMLLLALAAMLAWNPLLLWDDVGFQLSFVATAAMLGFASRVEDRCAFIPEAFGLRAAFASSLAAIAATFPVLLWHFGTVSVTAPVVNLVVLPLIPLLMALTGAALAAAFVHPALGAIAAVPAWAVSSVVLHVVAWFGAW